VIADYKNFCQIASYKRYWCFGIILDFCILFPKIVMSLKYQVAVFLKRLASENSYNSDLQTVSNLIFSALEIEDNERSFNEYSLYPLTLAEIYDRGVDTLKASTLQQSLQELDEDPKYKAFVELVSAKYFDGAEPGSLEYMQRQARLVKKYKEKKSTNPSKESLEKEAEEKKALGNAAITAKDYNNAIQYYTEAIDLSPDGPNSHIYYSNRAAAYTFQNEFELAIMDCESSIGLKNDFSKAYSRLGLCNFKLERYEEAVAAYEKLVELEPSNSTFQDELRKAKRKLEKSQVSTSARDTLEGNTGVPPGIAGLMNNPKMKEAMDRMGGQEGLAKLMQDPNMMAMAQKMMQNPAMMQQAMSMLGGGGGNMPDMSALQDMMGGGSGL
jgi:small glutamine-rich tetratricopeptide repeat-containing protein alpha